MNAILKCFFDDFDQMERNCLYARYKRRALADYFNTLIEGCRLGEERDVQSVVRDAVIGIIRYHENSRNNNGTVCIMGKYHDILYIGVKVSFDWQLKDTATVATLLDHIYSCEKTFERILVGAIFGTRAPHFIAGWKSDFGDQEENLRAMVFFLDHATNANLEYLYGQDSLPTRYVDIPIESCGKATCLKIAVQLGLPDKLHILLRYGALVDQEFDESECALECILNKLNDFNRSYPYNLVSCLQLLLRAVPSVNLQNNEYVMRNEIPQRLYVESKYGKLLEDGILPANRCRMVPPPLKHLCRCEIREALWRNYQLPNGIRTLPIPQPLHKYIDLLSD